MEWQSLPVPLSQLRLALVLPSGQSFRWRAAGNQFSFCLHDRVVVVRQDAEKLYYRTILPDPQPSPLELPLRTAETTLWINDYFHLGVDLAALYTEWQKRDQFFASISTRFSGIRILRQDPFENLISFICSSNNNITRITKMVNALCTNFAPRLLSEDGVDYHPFPTPQALASPSVEKTLRDLGFGYRAKFIQKTAQMLVETHGDDAQKFLAGLRTTPTDVAREELLKFMGVGRKVADCVLLMSLDKNEVVPVDTHVYQVAVKHYGLKGSSSKPNMTPKLYADINTRLASIWGEWAGWAQSVLFASDLKAFSSYDASANAAETLPTPPPTPALKRKNDSDEVESTPSRRRKRT
ncbi:N-glycosylase/DNA lyase [Mycena indigotica]|uniref:N-glycosylase/DNA lyase n=1 Tax=Mycena indigotica TaxID=2126181 RepID=A0A8H6VYG4_9AGAR|nr:N-glycosylase/DNA lyase [Mycena indigotica]KAF7294858.1 N-glycosylase/DNA lyase [Mycena indigotica]